MKKNIILPLVFLSLLLSATGCGNKKQQSCCTTAELLY